MERVVINIPQEVSPSLNGNTLTLSGKVGSITKTFDFKNLKIVLDKGAITVESESSAFLNSAIAHIKNMIKGAQEGYFKKMRVVYSHFPIALETKGDTLIIKNFLGEKKPRTCKIIGQTKISISGKEVIISGPSVEDVGQTIANIRAATKIKNRDSRIFQDGIYPVKE
ncbi:MAG: 50S ribosomal protein L6 [Candidatus Anstonellales archaeon]